MKNHYRRFHQVGQQHRKLGERVQERNVHGPTRLNRKLFAWEEVWASVGLKVWRAQADIGRNIIGRT